MIRQFAFIAFCLAAFWAGAAAFVVPQAMPTIFVSVGLGTFWVMCFFYCAGGAHRGGLGG